MLKVRLNSIGHMYCDPIRSVYGLANASFNISYQNSANCYIAWNVFSDSIHDEAGCMDVRSGVHRRCFRRLVMSVPVLRQYALNIILCS